MGRRNEPLWRKVNTIARRVRHLRGGDYRHDRNSKGETGSDALRGWMASGVRRGLDYTPLFRFLLSRVGQPWDEVYAEAVSRLDRSDPIFCLVARNERERRAVVRVGESTYFHGLYVDEQGRLAVVAPDVTIETLEPSCACCTHTLDGVPFVRPFRESSR